MKLPRSIAAWLLLLWGPLIWFAHFGFVYAAASIELTLTPRAGPVSRLAIALATLVALVLIGVAWARAPRFAPGKDELFRFWVSGARLLCLIAAVAIVWQSFPALIVP